MRIDGQLEGLRGEGSQGRVIGAAGAGQWIKAIKQWAKGQRQASVERRAEAITFLDRQRD